MSSINIISFSGQEFYCCWYLNLKYFFTYQYYNKCALTEQIVPVGLVSLDNVMKERCHCVPQA